MSTFFVVRDTNHPEEDLKRNWSSVIGGFSNGDFVGLTFKTREQLEAYWNKYYQGEVKAPAFRYHPAYESFVEVHYEGLGAWNLEAETLEEALEEAAQMSDDLACTSEKGDGHFFASQVVSYHKVREGKYVFELRNNE